MRRLAVSIVAASVMCIAATPALATGNFPEQPGTNVSTMCTTLLTNPGSIPVAVAHESPTAAGIIGPLYLDACFGH